MPSKKRFKTDRTGVYYIESVSAGGKTEKIYYITYRKSGYVVEEKAGRQYQDHMTPAKAALMRARRIDGTEDTNKAKRQKAKAEKAAQQNRWTIDKIAEEYFRGRSPGKSLRTDRLRYEKHLKPIFGEKEPHELVALDVDRVRIKLSKKLAPQTVKHVLNLLTWIVNFGVKKQLCDGLKFHIQKPSVNNLLTEDLSPEELKRLLDAIEKSSNTQIKALMKLVMVTGLRRGECLRLKWKDVDFDRGFINIRDPKGGIDQKIPLNEAARGILSSHPRQKKSEYVFPGKDGGQRASVQAAVNKIKNKANLPPNFRPLHGLRHHFASTLASSGAVDMYVLQRLLTHKDSRMTQRYAHLRDEVLRNASDLAGEIIRDNTKRTVDEEVIEMKNNQH